MINRFYKNVLTLEYMTVTYINCYMSIFYVRYIYPYRIIVTVYYHERNQICLCILNLANLLLLNGKVMLLMYSVFRLQKINFQIINLTLIYQTWN